MPAGTIGAGDFWSANDEWITAVVSIALAVAVGFVVNRWLSNRGRRIAEAVMRGELTPEVDTRLRFMRRLLYAVIVLIGIAIALSQVTGLDRLATSLLASSAIAAAVIGFAARQTLANVVAGIMLAITQPLRVGDWVTFEDHYGVVEDVRLNFTLLRTPSDQRVIIPNEKLAAGILRNDTLVSPQIGLDVAIWLPHGVDIDAVLQALEDETGAPPSVAETTPEGIRLAVSGRPCAPPERAGREADLRARCLRRLRAERLLPEPAEQGWGPGTRNPIS